MARFDKKQTDPSHNCEAGAFVMPEEIAPAIWPLRAIWFLLPFPLDWLAGLVIPSMLPRTLRPDWPFRSRSP